MSSEGLRGMLSFTCHNPAIHQDSVFFLWVVTDCSSLFASCLLCAVSRSLGSGSQRQLSRKQMLNLAESVANSLKAVGKESDILFRVLRSVRAV
jgi:hypothetical protein